MDKTYTELLRTLNENKDGHHVYLSVDLNHEIHAVHDSKKAGMKYMVMGDGPDGHFLVKTTRKALGKKRVGRFVGSRISRHLDKQPFPHDDGPHYSVHKESVEFDEGIMDKIKQLATGTKEKTAKKRNSGNAEQAKIATDINRKLKLIDGLMKKVKPLGGKMTRMTSFRKTPIEKMTPKDLYRALNDWYLSIDDYLNDNPEVDKRHGSTVDKLYSLWEEVSDKILDYMWASGYNVERGKRGKGGAPNKMGNIITDVIKPGTVPVQTKKLKVGGKLVDIDYNVPKRTDAKWLKMNESVELDENIVNKFIDKGLNKVLDKLEKMTGKHLGFVQKSTVPSAGKDRGNEFPKLKKEAEDFHRKAKKQWTWSKREVGDSFKYYGNIKVPTEQREAVSDLQAEMQKIIDMHTQLEKMMQTTGNSVKYQRTMEKLERDTNRVFKEIGKVTERGNAKYRAMQGMDNLRKAKKMTHKEPRQINPVKFRAYANRGESVELDEKAPKMKGDWLKQERERNNKHDDAMGRTKTGRKKPTRTMTSTQKTLSDISKRADKMSRESVDEGFMDKMKQLVPGAKGKPQKLPKGKKTAMEMQFPYARLSVHRMIVALRKAKGTAMKGKAQGKDRRENERSLGFILAHVEDIARNRHAEQPNSGRQIHDAGNIDDATQQYFMDKIRQNDWTKADQEILNAMVGNGTDDNTKGGAYHARTLAHDIALSVKHAKKDAGIKESVDIRNVARGMGVDPDNVIRGMGKGPHAKKDKARAAKEPKPTLKSRAGNVLRGLGVNPDDVARGMGFKESVELDEDHCLVCKDCGDELNKPTTDCENDCSDPNGSHWVKQYNEATEVDELAQIDAELKAIKDRMVEKTQNEDYELTEDDLPEAWTPGMRRAAARRMKVLAPRIKLGIKRSKNRTATKEKLMNRAVRKVKSDLIKKFTKGSSKTDLSPARRADMEKRIAKLGPRIKQLAQKQLPATRRMEVDRKRNRNK